MSTAIPAPAPHSPPEQWPDDEFDLPPDVDLLQYSKARSSLASTLAFESSSDRGSSKEPEDEEDWDAEFDEAPAPALGLTVQNPVVVGTVTRLRSKSPSPAPEIMEDGLELDGADDLLSPLKIKQRQVVEEPDWDLEEDDSGKGDTIKAPTGLGVSALTDDTDFESAFALPPNALHLTPPHASAWDTSSSSLSLSLSLGTPSTATSTSATDDSTSCSCPDSPSTSTHAHHSPPPSADDEGDDEVVFPPHVTTAVLRSILARKKAQPPLLHDEPFEHGLLIAHDEDLSPSRLRRQLARSTTAAAVPTTTSSKLSSQLPRPRSVAAPRRPPLPSAPNSFLHPPPPRPTIKHQKSTSGLHLQPPPSPTPDSLLPRPTSANKLRRKASLSTLLPSGPSPRKKTGPNSGSTSSADSLSPLSPHPHPHPRANTPSGSGSKSRLTMPTVSSLAKTKKRPALAGVFPTSPSETSESPSPIKTVARLLKRPRAGAGAGRGGIWGTGRELDGIEDLPVGSGSGTGTVGKRGLKRSSSPSALLPKAKSPIPPSFSKHMPSQPPRRPKSRAEARRPASRLDMSRPKSRADHLPPPPRPEKAKGPTLIKDLGSVGVPRTLNGMRWNPTLKRWDGHEEILRLFDAPAPPARPALITHLTGALGSPVLASAGVRVVGEMMFDPVKMCWLRRDGADEEDVFASESEEQDQELGTIRAKAGVLIVEPESEVVDQELARECRQAEARHAEEMRAWRGGMRAELDEDEEGRSWLWEIRAVATRPF